MQQNKLFTTPSLKTAEEETVNTFSSNPYDGEYAVK